MNYPNIAFLLAIGLLAGLATKAQVLTNNGAALYIPSGDTLTVAGSMRSTGSAVLQNNGLLQTSGDWFHDGTLVYSGSGALELNGVTPQSFTPTTFYDLLVSGAGVKSPSDSFTVAHLLLFRPDASATIANTAATIVTLGDNALLSETETGYVDGWVQTTRTVAAGVPESFGGIGLRLTASGAAPGSTDIVRGTGATAVQNIQGQPGIARVFQISSEINSGLNATVQFSYHNSELNNLGEIALTLYGSSDVGAAWQRLGQVARDTAANTVTMNELHALGLLTLGSASAPLPVTWLSFTGSPEVGGNKLRWRTVSEANSAFFAVERSADALNFEVIGRVAAAGSSLVPTSYSFLDPFAGAAFYRIREVDLDGRALFSRTIRIVGLLDRSPTVFPTVFQDALCLRFVSRPGSASVSLALTNANGAILWRQQTTLAPGASELNVSGLSNLPAGPYFLLWQEEGGRCSVTRLIHQHR